VSTLARLSGREVERLTHRLPFNTRTTTLAMAARIVKARPNRSSTP